MQSEPLVVVSLPFEGLESLVQGTGARLTDEAELRRARGFAPALLVYQTPWTFLERQLRLLDEPPVAEPEIESFAREALASWSAYHGALLDLAGRPQAPSALLNADRPCASGAFTALLRERFGRDAAPEPAPWGSAFPAASEESYWQVVNRLAPDCLELYGTLEAQAAWMGRRPEPGRGRFPARAGALSNLLRSELAGLAPRYEAQLYRAQLAQVEEELKRQAELNRHKDRQIADLTRRVEGRLRPALRRLAGLAARLGRGVLARAARLPFAGGFARAARRKKFRLQARRIRASGLFDAPWYLQKYPDVARAGLDPIEHYLIYGVSDGRNPSAEFNTRGYLSAHPDVAASGMNPLLHYIQFGQREGRRSTKPRAPASSQQ